MTLRDSLDLIRMVRPEAGTAALAHEIAAERASSLSLAEKRIKASLAALASADDTNRDDRLAQAQLYVWEYFVQRELVGFRGHKDVIADLGIPPEVLRGLGAAHTLKAAAR